MTTNDRILLKDPGYVEGVGVSSLYGSLYERSVPMAVEGPKGVGKSLSIASFAFRKQVPFISVACSEDMRRSNLVGQFVLKGDSTPFIYGPLAEAVQIANKVGDCILCMEEVNALSPSMQKLLNPLLDFRKEVYIPESEEVLRVEVGKRLWVVATMNPASYAGTYELNEDLRSRFRILPVGYPSRKQETLILSKVTNSKQIEGLITLAEETRRGEAVLGYALSTRDLVQIAEDMSLGISKALQLASGKFPKATRSTFWNRAKAALEDVVVPDEY